MAPHPTLDELHQLYPPDLRKDLVDWATDQRKPPGWAPPANVREHLVAQFSAAHSAGRRRGVVTALLFCWLPALCMIAIALATGAR